MRRVALGGLALATLAGIPSYSAERSLSRTERRIVAHVDAHVGEAIALLETVVNIPSGTLNRAGVRRVGEVFQHELDSVGFRTRWSEMPPGMQRAGHLIAELHGRRGKRLLLLGHLDTVLEGEAFERRGDRAQGNGTVDMKAGDVILIQALKALHATRSLDGARMTVIFTGDEEDAGDPIEVSRRDLIDAAAHSDVALSYEATVDDTATVARRGASRWRLRVSGVSGHSSGIFSEEVGSGAVFEAARILDAFYRELRGEEYLTFNPSVVVGGTDVDYDAVTKRGTAGGKTNVVPQTVVVEGDLRFISEEQKERARSRMRTIVSQSLPRASAQIEFEDEYPAMSPKSGNERILAILCKASEDLGLGSVQALDPGRRGAGDISFVAAQLDSLDGLGARGDNSHRPDEYVELDSLPSLIKRNALLLYRLTR